MYIQMEITISKMCICNSFKKPVDHGIIQFIFTSEWHKWRNSKEVFQVQQSNFSQVKINCIISVSNTMYSISLKD